VFRSILCPVDFSRDSQAALRYAHALARRMRGRLTALFVTDPFLAGAAAAVYGSGVSLPDRTLEELERFVVRTLGGAPHVACRVASGDPARTILAAPADLVVIGTHGLGGVGKLFFGSTTARVLARTRVPVLAVPATHGRRRRLRPPAGWPRGRVVAPLALDRTSRGSAARAARVARRFHAGLTFVHAVAPIPVPPFMGGSALRQEREALARARAAMARIAGAIRGVSVRAVVTPGYPADVIAALAARRDHSLVVVTLDPRGARFSAPPGRISYHVLQRGAAPVLALPAGWR